MFTIDHSLCEVVVLPDLAGRETPVDEQTGSVCEDS